MKKLFSAKKIYVIISAVIVVSLLAAGSFAWFAGRAATNESMTMGRVKMDLITTGVDPDYFYEPGEQIDFEFTLDNIHAGSDYYKPVFVQANFAAGTVVISSDANGDPVEPVEWPVDPSTIETTSVVYSAIDPDTYKLALWFVDRTTGIYYALIDDGMSATAAVNIELLGSAMGNEYQAAQFNFSGNFPYTQALDDAILDVLGLDLDNLDPINFEGTILPLSGMSTYSVNSERDYFMGLLYEALGR